MVFISRDKIFIALTKCLKDEDPNVRKVRLLYFGTE